jgi:hypothetical protein
MATYTVYVNAYFSDSVDVEAEDEQEAMDLAVTEFEQAYTVVCGMGLSWDNVEADFAELQDEEDE